MYCGILTSLDCLNPEEDGMTYVWNVINHLRGDTEVLDLQWVGWKSLKSRSVTYYDMNGVLLHLDPCYVY